MFVRSVRVCQHRGTSHRRQAGSLSQYQTCWLHFLAHTKPAINHQTPSQNQLLQTSQEAVCTGLSILVTKPTFSNSTRQCASMI